MALDANLMLAIDARRFFCAMQELTGGSVLLGDQAYQETWHRSAETGRRAAERTVEHWVAESGQDWSAADHARTEDLAWANTRGWRRWMADERERNDAVWYYAGSPREADKLQSAILGTGALTDNRKRAQDAMVVAEAILSGAHMVASDNLRSIRHTVLNQWLERRKASGDPMLKHTPLPFVLDPDAAVDYRCASVAPNDPTGRLALRWAIGACAPNSSVPASQYDNILRRFLDNLYSAGARVTAQTAADHLTDQQALHPNTWMDALIAQSPLAHRTRDAEDRRLALSRQP